VQGFFPRTELMTVRPETLLTPKCNKCGLWEGCSSPKMTPTGKGNRRVLIVGEAPGENEDRVGKQFVGESGERLKTVLDSLDVDFRKDCWIDNAVRCHPEANKLPEKAVDYCRANLINTIKELNPEVIILLGGTAVQSLIGWLRNEKKPGGVMQWAGWQIPSQRLNAWVCPTYHPAFLGYLKENQGQKAAETLWKKHLKAAFELRGRPWNKIPDYESKVDVIYEEEEATEEIYQFFVRKNPISFDFETNMLKADHEDGFLYCCSMSDGKKTIAYPMTAQTEAATASLLKSKVPKMGWNLKFEEAWAREKLGVRVKNWVWDGMVAAHLLDCRDGITGLKFQSFVRLGVEPYEEKMKEYLKSFDKGGYVPNKIKQAGLRSTLIYCGLDSLFEYKVGRMQMKEMGVEL
jgi:uracil-DNA glycosylase family 4